MKMRCKKIIALLLLVTTLASSNVALATSLSSGGNSELDLVEISSKLMAVAAPLPVEQIIELIEALINALGLAAALALLRDITGDLSLTSEKAVKEKKIIPIYRWGAHSYTNLTPRPQDTNGLSFNTVYPAGRDEFVVTTYNAVNESGVLIAIIDNPRTGHVSVKPNPVQGSFAMQNWIGSRPTAETKPYYLTRFLYGITAPVN